jgi:hypothetical protein
MNLFFVGCFVAGIICFSLFMREDYQGRLTLRHTWKDMTIYHWVLFSGISLFPIGLVGLLVAKGVE